MNRRVKTYILIGILSLIMVLIVGMYLELIAQAIDFNHTPVRVESNQTLPGLKGNRETSYYIMPEKLFPLVIPDPISTQSAHPPSSSTDQEMDPYPGASSSP